jgi:hypothetical protein
MIQRQLGPRRRVGGAISLTCAPLFAFIIGGPSGPASAGEFDRSTLPAAVAGPAHCDSRGDGFGAFKDTGGCKRISGYIAAGARFGSDQEIGGRPSLFGPLDAPEFVGSVRASGAAIIDAPSGQDRFFLPPGPGDEAR